MSAFRSRLFWKAFLSLLLGLLIWLPAFYWLTVPLVNHLAYDVEEKAGRAVLDSVEQIVGQSQRDLEAWRQTTLDAHRRELKNIVQLVDSWIGQMEADVAAGKLSRNEARRQILERLRHFRYGNNDYVWAADYDSVLVSHPDAGMQGRNAANLRDTKGNLVIPTMVRQARQAGEGYFSYWWSRLDTGREAEKLGYFRDFPSWQLVIGTGVYIDDVDAEVARCRAAMIDDLRRHLHSIKVATSGDVFVMDGKMNAIIHADPDVEGKSMAKLLDPDSGKPLGEEFIAAAERSNKTLAYRGARLDEPGGKLYDKVAWVDYIPEYGWYLGASAYVEDLGRSGDFLAGRILIAFVLGLIITALIAFAFIRTLTAPILRLAQAAGRAQAGDLSVASGIRRDDEIGVLAEAFDNMVGRLKEQIETLEQRVEERTHEIAEWAVQLEALVAVRTTEARASEAKFRGLVEQSLVGIMVVQDGKVRYANPCFARMHGYEDPASMVGQSPTRFLAAEEVAGVEEINRQLLDGEIPYVRFEVTGQCRDGRRVDHEGHAYRSSYEGQPAIIVLALDIGERKRVETARDAALAAAEALSRMKSQFMANISHELRTPLNGIMGFAHIGQRASDVAKARAACERIAEASRHLLRQVENVLDFSSLETGQLQLESVVFEPAHLLAEVCGVAKAHAEAKGLEFHVAADLGAAERCRADAGRIARVLGILLDNAVKFTEKGSITLSLDREGDALVFGVADTGIGMSAEEVGRLFRPFEQIDASSTRRYDGMGLGLALAERLVTFMGGTIRVASVAGEGTAVKVRLPVEDAAGEEVTVLAAADRDFSI